VPRIQIPLFPLKTVLFPGAELPLLVFEERYQTMTRELLEQGGVFGVVLIKHGNEIGGSAVPHDYGTTAHIESAEETGRGRIRLHTRGVHRFRLIRSLPPRPYPFGEVEILDDDEELGPPGLRAMETVRAMFPNYFRLAFSLTEQWARPPELPAGGHKLVDFAMRWVQSDEEVKQRILEIEQAEERLAALAELLDDLLSRLRVDVEQYRRRRFGGFGAQS
jgi:Lon protease-like protein